MGEGTRNATLRACTPARVAVIAPDQIDRKGNGDSCGRKATRDLSAAEHHGSESYYVVGEGLLGESVGGRERTLARTVEAEAPPFRFSRMGPVGGRRQLPDATLRKLGNAMAVGGGGSSQIPAGFTYLGQFIDHDLTFDKTSVTFGDSVSPAELLQAAPRPRPRLAVRRGAADPESAKFYAADGIHLKMGKTSPSRARPRATASTCRAAPGPRARRSEKRSSPTRGTTRTSRSPRPTSPSSASTTASSTRSRAPSRPRSASTARAGSSRATTSG